MNGSDHLAPQPWLGPGRGRGQRPPGRLRLRGHLAPRRTSPPRPPTGSSTWKGELRSGFRANVLMGVTSNRVDVKRMGGAGRAGARAAGRALGRPVPARPSWPAACSTWPGGRWSATPPTTRSAPARSTTSSTPCCTASPRRGPSPTGSPTGPSRRSPARWPSRAPTCQPGPTGPGAWSSSWSGPTSRRRPTSRCSPSASGLPGSMALDADTVRTVLGMLQGPKIDNDAWVQDVGVEEDDEGIDITVAFGPEERPNVPIAEAKQDLYTRLGARPDAVVRVRLDQPPIRRIVARVAEVAGLRLAGVRAGAAGPPGRRPTRAGRPVVALQRAGHGRGRRPTTAPSRSTGGRVSAGSSTAATSGTPTTTPRPGRTARRHPDSVAVRVARARAGAGPRRASPPPTPGPTTSTAPPRPGSASTRVEVDDHPRAARRRAARCG